MSNPYGQQPEYPPQYGAPPPQMYGHPPGPPLRRKKSSAGKILLIIGACVVVLFGGCTVLIASIGTSNKPTTATAAQDKAEAENSQQANSEEPVEKVPAIGDVVKDGKFSFKVTKLERRASVGSSFLNKQAQGVYLLVYVTVKNIGDEAQAFSGSAQKLFDSKGREFEASSEAAIYLKNSSSLYEEINPGNSVKGVVLFDIPKTTKYKTIELHDSLFSDGIKVALS